MSLWLPWKHTGDVFICSKTCEYFRYYIQAKERMANVYLLFEKNKEQYIQCYQELAEKLPGPPTAQLLGDALMNVQEVCTCIYVCKYL